MTPTRSGCSNLHRYGGKRTCKRLCHFPPLTGGGRHQGKEATSKANTVCLNAFIPLCLYAFLVALLPRCLVALNFSNI